MKMEVNSSSFMTAKTVKKGQIVTILDEGEWRKNTKYTYEDGTPKNECVFKVKSEGEEYQLRMNKASRIAMVEAFGDESAEWVGKQARIIIMATPNGGNKMIVLDPIMDELDEPKAKSTKPEEIDWE